jgi:hypothetical protein
MRWIGVPTAAFTDINGVSRTVHDMKPIETFPAVTVIARNAADDFDEIASREAIYGAGGESQSYKLDEANIVDIFDNLLNYDALSRIKVPR